MRGVARKLDVRGPDPNTGTPTETWRRLRLQMLQAERAAVLAIRDGGQADHEVLQSVLFALDLEESMLDRVADREGWSGCTFGSASTAATSAAAARHPAATRSGTSMRWAIR